MAKTARLDQILLRLRYADEDQITRALRRQKTHGGRLGLNLVEMGIITEDQLLSALAEQYGLPTLQPREKDVPRELLSRMPADVVADGVAVPISWNESARVLSLAVSCPDDMDLIRRVKEAFDAKAVRVSLAPDGVLAALGRRLVPRPEPGPAPAGPRRIRLPELFAQEPEPALPEGRDSEAAPEDPTRVVMVTSLPSRRHFLPSVFEREGLTLNVASDRAEAEELLARPDVARVLVSEEMAGEFAVWLAQGMPRPQAEVVAFRSVSDALLGNPLPYDVTARSLRSAVQALADYRCGELGLSPPYGLIAADVEALARRHGLGRVAGDALNLAAHLLLPTRTLDGPEVLGSSEPFGAFASSLELATRLRFAWSLDALLAACHGLFSGQADPTERGERPEEMHLAAQILSLAWYRHNHAQPLTGTDEERVLALRAELRAAGARLAGTELVESYLQLIAERGDVRDEVGDRQVLLVGGSRIGRALSPALARVGREAVVTADLGDAQTMAERRPPAAIVLDHGEFPQQVQKFTRVTKLGGRALLFVVTDSTDPALVLNLLDVGVDDVFGPPLDYDLVAARINRAIRSRARAVPGEAQEAGQFSANFEVFGFLDLIQMLSQGLKTVRISLSRRGEKAVLYMRKGRLCHAVAGDLKGPPAVYDVIRWEDEGEFVVREETEFPEDSIEVSTESVLMEGLRLLDEGKRKR